MLRSVSSSLTHVMGNQTRRRLGLSAAVISSVAHPFLFSSEALQDPKVAAIHLDGGAIHESICNLVSIGQSYNRLLIQLSCHIGSLLSERPNLGLQYRVVIEELALSGFGPIMMRLWKGWTSLPWTRRQVKTALKALIDVSGLARP